MSAPGRFSPYANASSRHQSPLMPCSRTTGPQSFICSDRNRRSSSGPASSIGDLQVLGNLPVDGGVAQGLGQRGAETLDDRLGRAGGGEYTPPRISLEVGKAALDRGRNL